MSTPASSGPMMTPALNTTWFSALAAGTWAGRHQPRDDGAAGRGVDREQRRLHADEGPQHGQRTGPASSACTHSARLVRASPEPVISSRVRRSIASAIAPPKRPNTISGSSATMWSGRRRGNCGSRHRPARVRRRLVIWLPITVTVWPSQRRRKAGTGSGRVSTAIPRRRREPRQVMPVRERVVRSPRARPRRSVAVPQPVVQPVLPALPELDRRRADAEPAPEVRQRHRGVSG